MEELRERSVVQQILEGLLGNKDLPAEMEASSKELGTVTAEELSITFSI